MKVYIKNLVCPLFKFFVKKELEKLQLEYRMVGQRGIDILGNVTEAQLRQLEIELKPYGLELSISASRSNLIGRIKVAINHLLSCSSDELKIMLPEYINRNFSYNSLNKVFRRETGSSIEEYYNKKKIEKAKELIQYYSLSPVEVTYQLGYTNITDLMNQFKKVTTSIPEQFLQIV